MKTNWSRKRLAERAKSVMIYRADKWRPVQELDQCIDRMRTLWDAYYRRKHVDKEL